MRLSLISGNCAAMKTSIETRGQMRVLVTLLFFAGLSGCAFAAPITADLSAIKPGPIDVESSNQSLHVTWSDAANQIGQWSRSDSSTPLITSISVDGRNIVSEAKRVPLHHRQTNRGLGRLL